MEIFSYGNTNLFDGADDFELGTGVEMMSLFTQQQLQIACDVAAGDVGSHHTMRHCKSLVDRHRMSYTVSRV